MTLLLGSVLAPPSRGWDLEVVTRRQTYLSAKQAEGPAQTTARLLEARIGELLPRGDKGRGKTSVATNVSIPRIEAHDFRLMAEHRDVWEDRQRQGPATRGKPQPALRGGQ